jgi:cob(I)alamin adenosyltransferase
MKGLLLTITGDGKGKTTSALGTVIRALGRGWRVTILQFVKNGDITGEKLFFEKFSDQVIMEQLGEGFSWQNKDHSAAAEAGWQKALPWLNGEKTCDLLVLDELNIALHYNWLDPEKVLNALKNRKEELNVIVTGRNAPEELIRCSDLVSRIENIKHPFDSGIPGKEGIDF